jgi:hypothetical protein
MFSILSDLSLVLRREFPVDDSLNDVLASGVAGVWVTLGTGGYAKRTQTVGAGPAWPVFNDSARDQSVLGWTPDVKNSKKISVLCGNYYARTDQYTSITSVGQALTVGANGKLVAGTEGTHAIFGYCVKAPYTYSYLGNSLTVIDVYINN